MNIAICDDEKNFAELFGDKVRTEYDNCDIYVFTSGIEMIKSGIFFDVAFLDIEMDDMNGFHLAEFLNKNQPRCVFSFITIHGELAVDGYDYQPFRYILKSAPEAVIKRKISETLNEYYRRSKVLHVEYKGKHSKVLVSDIVYIEVDGHRMKLVLEKGELLWGKQLNEVENDFGDYGLVRCHKSYIAGLQHIEEFNSSKIKMKNGDLIPIGRKYKARFIEEHKHFTIMSGGN